MSHHMSRVRQGWWFGLVMLVVTNALLYVNYRSIHALRDEHHRVVALLHDWSTHLAELDSHVRLLEESEHDLDKRQRILATEISALQVFRKTMKKLPNKK